jgi:hypothetical protein
MQVFSMIISKCLAKFFLVAKYKMYMMNLFIQAKRNSLNQGLKNIGFDPSPLPQEHHSSQKKNDSHSPPSHVKFFPNN